MDNIIEATGRLSETIGEKLGLLQHREVVTGKIFITGCGTIGWRVALRILAAGYPSLRVGFRHPDDECAQELSQKGAEIADFWWKDESTFEKALEGCKIVFCITPYIQNWANAFPAFLRACEKAGVQYFVKVSGIVALLYERGHCSSFSASCMCRTLDFAKVSFYHSRRTVSKSCTLWFEVKRLYISSFCHCMRLSLSQG